MFTQERWDDSTRPAYEKYESAFMSRRFLARYEFRCLLQQCDDSEEVLAQVGGEPARARDTAFTIA